MRAAIDLFGAVYLGLDMPIDAQNQPTLWDALSDYPNGNGAPGSWGGHAVPLVGYDPNELKLVTWGQEIAETYKFSACYCTEAYAILSTDWANGTLNAPSGFNFTQLQADLAALT
jgi:hypothetical protein